VTVLVLKGLAYESGWYTGKPLWSVFTSIGLVGCEVVDVGLGVPEAGRLGDSSPWCCTVHLPAPPDPD